MRDLSLLKGGVLTAHRYGPHKIAKTLHHAFCMTSNGSPLATSLRSPPQSAPPPSLLGFHFDVHTTSRPTALGFAVPAPLSLKENQKREQEHPAVVPDTPTSPSLPVARPQAPGTAAPANGYAPDHHAVGGLRVLLVEDNEINLKLLIATMKKLKLEHATAINGLEALNSYKECAGAFDVIFMGSSLALFPLSFLFPAPLLDICRSSSWSLADATYQTSRCPSCPASNPPDTSAASSKKPACRPWP